MRIETAPGGAFRPVPAIEIEVGGWILTRMDSARSRRWHRVREVTSPYPEVLYIDLDRPKGGTAREVHALYDPVIYQATLPATPSPVQDVRAALQVAFPQTEFIVRPMVDGASVSWTDGPTRRQVVDVVKTVESCWRWKLHRTVGFHTVP